MLDEHTEMEERIKVLASEPKALNALAVFKAHLVSLGWSVDLAIDNDVIKMTAQRGKEK